MKKYLFLLILLVVGVIAGHLLTVDAPIAQADVTPSYPLNINGWLWTSNVGFFKLDDTGFQVQIGADGDITGYGFSSNVGWLKFGPFDGDANFPAAQGEYGTNEYGAHIDISTGKLTGWIRACSATENSDCGTGVTRAGGWDGWISLSGIIPGGSSYGVTLSTSTGVISGKAWGGEVIGWLDFNQVICPSCIGIVVDPGPAPTCNLTATPATIDPADPHTVAITWNSTNATACYGSNFVTANATSGSIPSKNIVGTTNYGLSCVNATHPNPMACDSKTVTVNTPVAQSAHLYIGSTVASANAANLQVVRGKPFALKWENPDGYDCTNTAPSQWSQWSDANYAFFESGNSGTDLTTTATTPVGTYAFTLSCRDYSATLLPVQTVQLKVISSIEIEI
ncbi:MAG: hypothetical protein V4481_04340 [Patescibacteria group bacterium]